MTGLGIARGMLITLWHFVQTYTDDLAASLSAIAMTRKPSTRR